MPASSLRYSRFMPQTLLLLALILPFEGHTASIAEKPQPQTIKSFLQLKKLIKSKAPDYSVLRTGVLYNAVPMAAAGTATDTSDSGNVDYSSTNVQVEGVDEGDTVKTDGNTIYSLQNGQVRIIQAYPANKLALLSTLQFDKEFTPLELFVEGNRLVVIGQGFRNLETDDTGNQNPGAADTMKLAIWYPRGESETLIRIYKINDKTQPVLEREISFDGAYLSARKMGNNVYVTGRKYPLFTPYYIRPYIAVDPVITPDAIPATTQAKRKKITRPELTREQIVPRIRDSRAYKGEEIYLPMKRIYYFPDFAEANYIMVGSFQLDKPNQPVDFKSYLGAGDIVYASAENLYISAAEYNKDNEDTVTHIYKFALNNGKVDFSNVGEVPGTPLNQFSLDENQGYFRIATTVNHWTFDGVNGQNQTWNNLYTLDSGMQLKGKLEHLAEGERIYSARFMGNKAYLVTFEQVDPLSVIDLANPEEPKLLGELKIPGFSNYLHPYDENHIMGLGQDTVASTTGGAPIPKGVKLALFDVTDPTHPAEMHSLVIGGKGSYSQAAYDHKALWFDKKRSLLGFPIEETASDGSSSPDQWPERIFQGAQVYSVSLEEGFTKKGAITHLDGNQNEYDWSHYVQRLLSIGDELYTFSESRLRVNSLKDFSQSGQLDFTVETPVDDSLPVAASPVESASAPKP